MADTVERTGPRGTTRGDKRRTALLGAVVLLVALVAFNTVSVFTLGWLRADLTQEGLYTISPGVLDTVRSLDEPVRLDLYWTAKTGADAPQVRAHAQRVREFLEALAAESDGKVILTVIDPEPFSEAEDAARAAGVATRPRGVRMRKPMRTRNGSATVSMVSGSSPTATASVPSPTGPPAKRRMTTSSTARSMRSRPRVSTS